MTVFVKPRDLKVFENESEIVLRKGFVHINEVTIDKKGSSGAFLKNLSKLSAAGRAPVAEADESHPDFLQLFKLDLIGIESEGGELVISQLELPKWFSDKHPTLPLSQLMDKKEERIVREGKSPGEVREILEKARKKLAGSGKAYVIDHFAHFPSLRAANQLLFDLGKEFAIGFVDSENVYLTGVRPGYTGCYKCLEQHVMSKFTGHIEDYESCGADWGAGGGELTFLLAMVEQDAKNASKFSMSELTGNVAHMWIPNFEYSFGLNMKSSACPVCCKINNLKFKEQNIKSINVLKEYGGVQ